jgi:hypothetical protein
MDALFVGEGEFERLGRHVAKFDALRAAKFYGRRSPGLEVTEGRLDKSRLAALGAVQHFHDQVRNPLIHNHSAFADIGGRCHGLVFIGKFLEKSRLKWSVNGDPFGGEKIKLKSAVNLLFLRKYIEILLNRGADLRVGWLIFFKNYFFLTYFS